LNEKNLSPVHLATELNKVKALQLMGKHSDIFDVQQGGEHKRTALHLAAIYDHEECARILVGWKRILLFKWIDDDERFSDH
jgi:transient receptor potential cation channel subfamily A member 1